MVRPWVERVSHVDAIGENARIFFSEREKSVPAMRVTR